MAHLRDRRAFGNIGTRKFRGARFGDPLSPRGPQYTKEGRVLDYSTDVGPFTIVDKSGEGNTATLYSGRGLTMDGVGDLIDFGSPTFSEPVTSVTGYARSTDTSINLGLTSATLAGNDTWETFSADTPAKDYGDAQWFNGTDAEVGLGAGDPLGFNGSAKIEWRGYIYVTGTAPLNSSKTALATYVNGGSAGFSVSLNAANTLRVAGRSVSTDGFQNYVVAISNGLHYVKCYADFTNDEFGISIDEAAYTTQSATFANNTYTLGSTTNQTQIGAADSGNRWDSTLTDILILKDDVATNAYTGRGATPWTDTIGSNDGTVSGVDQTAAQYFTNPDFILGTGYNGDLSDVRCLGATGTVLGHWSLADWSNPSGNTSNGKTIVDSGPNQLHGTCTGCSGFTGEGIDPEVAGIVGLDDARWFNGVDTKVTSGAPISDVGAIEVKFIFSDTEGVVFLSQQNGVALYGLSVTQSRTAGNVHIALHRGSLAFEFISQSGFSAGELITATAFYNFTTSTFSINVNGGTGDGTLPGRHSPAASLNLFQIGANGNDTFFTNGIISDLKEYDTDQVTAIRHYTGLGNDPWADTIGSNDGTPIGTFVTVGQKRATIPQTADKNWNKRMWFSETDGRVAIPTSTSLFDGGGTISATAVSFDNGARIWEQGAVGAGQQHRLLINTAVGGFSTIAFRYRWSTSGDAIWITDSAVVQTGKSFTVSVAYNASSVANDPVITVDGVVAAITETVAPVGSRSTADTDLFLGNSESFTGAFRGIISDVSVNTSTYIGYGNSNADWVDQVGSNDGVVGGTTSNVLISASDANIQIDALGTAISEPRLNTQQLNLFGEGEYSRTADSASLDVTTAATWELWCEPIFLSNERPLISKYGTTGEMSWELQVDVTSARLAFLIAGADGNFRRTEWWSLNTQVTSMLSVTFDGGVVKLYQDAALLTFLGSAGSSAPTTLNAGTLPVIIGGRPVNGNVVRAFGGKFGSSKIYNVALTADEVLTNYNTQKSLYGL